MSGVATGTDSHDGRAEGMRQIATGTVPVAICVASHDGREGAVSLTVLRKLSTILRAWLSVRVGVLVLLGALLGLPGYVVGWRIWAAHELNVAQKALEARDFDSAWSHVNSYLRVHPNSPEGHLLAARIARRASLFAEAEDHLHVCQRLTGHTDALALERMLIATQRGDLTPEIEEILLADVDANHPDSAPILEALLQAYTKAYRLEDALNSTQQLLERQPNNTYALMRQAWVQERLQRFEEAMEAYQKVLEIEPNQKEARLHLGQSLLYGKNNPTMALPHFERLHQQDAGDLAASLGVAQCHFQLGHIEECRQLLDALVNVDAPEAAVLVERAKLAMAEGQPEDAEKWLRQALQGEPYSTGALYTLYLCLMQQGRKDEAQAFQQKLDRLKADTKRMETLTRAVQKNPYDADLRCEIAKLFMQLGEEREGERWLYTALRAVPWHRPSHLALAEYYERVGKTDLAQQHREMANRAATEAPGGRTPLPGPH